MATKLKVLGQMSGTGTLYTVPALTSAVISSIIVCNTSTSGTTFTVRISIAGGTTTTAQYIFHDIPLASNETKTYTLGITLAASDQIIVETFHTLGAMNVFGQEIT